MADCIIISLRVAVTAVAMGLIPGLTIACLLAYGRFRGKRILDVAVILPVALPPTVIGYYLLRFIGREGPLGSLVKAWGGSSLIFTPAAAVAAATMVSLPFLIQAARTSLEAVPQEVLEAAAVDGAKPLLLVWHILIPLAWPGICVGLLLAFARAMGEFGATIMVAGNIPGRTQTMPMAIYTAVQAGRLVDANLLVSLLTALSSLVIWSGLRWRSGAFVSHLASPF